MRPAGDSGDVSTARAFADSWNRAGEGSVYTREQFLDWFAPLDPASFAGKTVIELGFGNGSQLCHFAACRPARLCGIELGDTLEQARKNLARFGGSDVELHRGDLTTARLGEFDLAYCIGVLHHLRDPAEGFRAVLRHTKPGGHFHCWVYAHEGNLVVRALVDPIRRIASRLPWWITKYAIALPLVAPYYVWAKLVGWLDRRSLIRGLLGRLPLHEYSLWIAERPFGFFHHVAFDQLVTPRTVYLKRAEIEGWLKDPAVDPASVYVVFRNGNSWKFGGCKLRPA